MEQDKQLYSRDYSIWWMFAFVMEEFGINVSIHLKVTSLQICHSISGKKCLKSVNIWRSCKMVDCIALGFCLRRRRTRQISKIICVWRTETVTNCCYVNRQLNVSLLSTDIKLQQTRFDLLTVNSPAVIEFGKIWTPKKPSGDMYFTIEKNGVPLKCPLIYFVGYNVS